MTQKLIKLSKCHDFIKLSQTLAEKSDGNRESGPKNHISGESIILKLSNFAIEQWFVLNMDFNHGSH